MHRFNHPDPDVRDEALLSALATSVRRAYTDTPDEATASRHLAAMGAVTQARAPAPARRPPARRRSPLRRGLAVAATTIAGTAIASTALAAAGVPLPDPVRAPFEAVGVELPNQADEHATPERRAPAISIPPVAPAAQGDDKRGNEHGTLTRGTPSREQAAREPHREGAARRKLPGSSAAPRARGTSRGRALPRRGAAGRSGASGDTPAAENRGRAQERSARRQRREQARTRPLERARKRSNGRPVTPVAESPALSDPATTTQTEPDPALAEPGTAE